MSKSVNRVNRIFKKNFDFDWFYASLFDVLWARDHAGTGVQLQVSNWNIFKLDTCNWRPLPSDGILLTVLLLFLKLRENNFGFFTEKGTQRLPNLEICY